MGTCIWWMEREEHYEMDVDGPALCEDFKFDEGKDDEEETHRI